MLSDEQANEIKKQLLEQINSFPEDKRDIAKQQIQSMDNAQLEQFLIQNKLIKEDGTPTQSPQKCIFCSIVDQDIPSYKLDENKDSIAVLEINPISKAHTIIIPKKHDPNPDKLPKTVYSLAEKIAKKIKTKFKPKDVKTEPSVVFEHAILNVFPVYDDEKLDSQRTKAEQSELEDLHKKLAKKARAKPKTIKKPKAKKLGKEIKLPKRIP